MSINKFFSGKRFFRLLQHDFRINKKTYIWTLAGIILILFGINYFFLLAYKWQTRDFITSNYFFPFFLSVIVIIYFVGAAFPELNNRIKTQNFLLLPASVFEKFLSQFVIRFVVFLPLMFLLFFATARLVKASFYNVGTAWYLQSDNYDNLNLKDEISSSNIFDPTEAEINYKPTQIPDFTFDMLWSKSNNDLLWSGSNKIDYTLLFIWSLAFVSLFVVFAGTICFKRFALVKSVTVIGVLMACCGFATKFYKEYLISKTGLKEWQIMGYDDYFINTVFRRKFGVEFHPALFLLWMTLSICLLLGFSYFKLKEKEI